MAGVQEAFKSQVQPKPKAHKTYNPAKDIFTMKAARQPNLAARSADIYGGR